jgi:hypothetical protein
MSYKFAGRGLAVESTTRIRIIHPNGTPLRAVIKTKDGETVHECYVEGYSTDSRRANAFQQSVMDSAVQRTARATLAEADAMQADLLVALTTGWCLVSPDGDLIDEPFSPEAAKALYNDSEWKFLRDQVAAGLATRANFTRKSAAR